MSSCTFGAVTVAYRAKMSKHCCGSRVLFTNRRIQSEVGRIVMSQFVTLMQYAYSALSGSRVGDPVGRTKVIIADEYSAGPNTGSSASTHKTSERMSALFFHF